MTEQEQALGHLKILVKHLESKAAASKRHHDCGVVTHANNGTPSARALEFARITTLEDDTTARYARRVLNLFNQPEPDRQTATYETGTQTFTLSTTRSGKQYLRN